MQVMGVTVINSAFQTRPIVIHAHGYHSYKPYWQPIKEKFFALPPRRIGPIQELTIITWNNGGPAMGVLEKSLDHLGVPYVVMGAGIHPWINSQHKLQLTVAALATIRTAYVLGVDSRDAIVIDDPYLLVERFTRQFSCELLFSADLINWPTLSRFEKFEAVLPEARASRFRYLNSGMWIGKTEFCRAFFDAALNVPPVPEEPSSDQGIYKQMFPDYYPRLQLDYRCALFQNIGFVFTPMIEVR